jgi:ABC-2 type transport system ATP-binding protein
LVPQEISFPDAVRVGLCLDFVAGQRADLGLGPPRTELCDRLGLGGLLRRRVGGLSGGQRRKLAVALGLLHAPGLLILDEATTNLDESTRAVTWQLVRDYVNQGGAALVTSHILADIEAHADRVVALHAGEMVLCSPLADVRSRLGGSTVSLRVPAAARAEVAALVAHRQLGVGVASAGDEPLQWRTVAPVKLVAAVAPLVPGTAELDVRPTPLSDLLTATTPDAGANRRDGSC